MPCLKRSCREERYVLWILNGTVHKQKITSIFIWDQTEAIRTWRKTSVISSLQIWRLFFFFCRWSCLLFTSTFLVASQERQDINLEQELYIEMCKRYWDVSCRQRIIMNNLRQIRKRNKTNKQRSPSSASSRRQEKPATRFITPKAITRWWTISSLNMWPFRLNHHNLVNILLWAA